MARERRPFICDCGRAAVKKDQCRNPVCARCSKLESIRGHDGTYVKSKVPASHLGGIKGFKNWKYIAMFDNTPILLPDALARLDQMLKSAAKEC